MKPKYERAAAPPRQNVRDTIWIKRREVRHWELILNHPLSTDAAKFFARQRLYEMRIRQVGGLADGSPSKCMSRANARKTYLNDESYYEEHDEPQLQHLCPQPYVPILERFNLSGSTTPLDSAFTHKATQLIGFKPLGDIRGQYGWELEVPRQHKGRAIKHLGPLAHIAIQVNSISGDVIAGAVSLQAIADFNRSNDLLEMLRTLTYLHGGRFAVTPMKARYDTKRSS